MTRWMESFLSLQNTLGIGVGVKKYSSFPVYRMRQASWIETSLVAEDKTLVVALEQWGQLFFLPGMLQLKLCTPPWRPLPFLSFAVLCSLPPLWYAMCHTQRFPVPLTAHMLQVGHHCSWGDEVGHLMASIFALCLSNQLLFLFSIIFPS